MTATKESGNCHGVELHVWPLKAQTLLSGPPTEMIAYPGARPCHLQWQVPAALPWSKEPYCLDLAHMEPCSESDTPVLDIWYVYMSQDLAS